MKASRTLPLRAAAALLAWLLVLPAIALAAAPPSQASKLLDLTVFDGRNRRLGVVTDLVIDWDKAQVVGLQVGHNTADGMVHDVFAWPAVRVNMRDEKVFVSGTPYAQDVPDAQSLAKLLHAPLRDSQGKDACQISDLLFSLDDGHVASYVVQFDPKWLEMGAPAAIDLGSVERKPDGLVAKFTASDIRPTDGSKATPAAPPPPPPLHLARLSQATGADLDSLAKHPENLAIARHLLGARVVSQEGNVVGKVEDVVVDMNDGKPQFLVTSFIPDWVAAGLFVIVPVRPVTTDKEGKSAIRITLNEINNAFLFQSSSWPDFSNRAQNAAIHAKIDHM